MQELTKLKSANFKLLVLSRLAWSQLWRKTVSLPMYYVSNLEAHHPVKGDVSLKKIII